MVRFRTGFSIFTLIFMAVIATDSKAGERYKYGFSSGLGAYYANSFGVNFSYRAEQINFMALVGAYDHYGLGMQFYLRDESKAWQPRIGLTYGTNGDLRYSYDIDESDYKDSGYSQHYNGITLLLGQRFAFGRSRRHGVELDLGFKVSDGGYSARVDKIKEQNGGRFRDDGFGFFGVFFGDLDVLASVGWRMAF